MTSAPAAAHAQPHSHPHRIDLKIRELAQLFNSLDPSPFIERDLDTDAEEFILACAYEAPSAGPFELVVHLGTEPEPTRAAATADAVRHYFAARADLTRRRLRLLLRRGQLFLVIGLAFLALCLVLGNVATKALSAPVSDIVHEGFTIVGWVAMWRPLEIFLYDWWPMRDELRRLQRLARMHVRLVPPRDPAPSAASARTAA